MLVKEPSEKAKGFINAAWGMAEMTLRKHGEVHFFCALHNMDARDITIVPVHGLANKDAVEGLIALSAKFTPDADLIVVVAEAWMVTGSMDKYTPEAIAEMNKKGLKDHPDRIEIITVDWKTKYGEQGHQVRELLRLNKKQGSPGKPYLGARIELPNANLYCRWFEHVFENENKQ